LLGGRPFDIAGRMKEETKCKRAFGFATSSEGTGRPVDLGRGISLLPPDQSKTYNLGRIATPGPHYENTTVTVVRAAFPDGRPHGYFTFATTVYNDGWDQDYTWGRPDPTKFTVVILDARGGALTSGIFELRINCEMTGYPFFVSQDFEPAIFDSVASAHVYINGSYERC